MDDENACINELIDAIVAAEAQHENATRTLQEYPTALVHLFDGAPHRYREMAEEHIDVAVNLAQTVWQHGLFEHRGEPFVPDGTCGCSAQQLKGSHVVTCAHAPASPRTTSRFRSAYYDLSSEKSKRHSAQKKLREILHHFWSSDDDDCESEADGDDSQ
jgi:hypothetical protein